MAQNFDQIQRVTAALSALKVLRSSVGHIFETLGVGVCTDDAKYLLELQEQLNSVTVNLRYFLLCVQTDRSHNYYTFLSGTSRPQLVCCLCHRECFRWAIRRTCPKKLLWSARICIRCLSIAINGLKRYPFRYVPNHSCGFHKCPFFR